MSQYLAILYCCSRLKKKNISNIFSTNIIIIKCISNIIRINFQLFPIHFVSSLGHLIILLRPTENHYNISWSNYSSNISFYVKHISTFSWIYLKQNSNMTSPSNMKKISFRNICKTSYIYIYSFLCIDQFSDIGKTVDDWDWEVAQSPFSILSTQRFTIVSSFSEIVKKRNSAPAVILKR